MAQGLLDVILEPLRIIRERVETLIEYAYWTGFATGACAAAAVFFIAWILTRKQ